MKKNFLAENIGRFNERVKTHSDRNYFYSWSSFICNAVRYGCSPDDYFRYEFQKKSHSEKNKFITYRRSKKLIKTYNNSNDVSKVLDKITFNKTFSKFIKRKWLDINNCTYEDFVKFIYEHQSVIIKPVSAGSGVGIWKYAYNGNDDLQNVFKKVKGSLVEQVIKQHEILSKLNPSSINTVRVMTVNDGDRVHVIACSLRTGLGDSVVDNLHAGGGAASIDVKTGIVYTPAINAKLEKYLIHPSTGEKFIGLTIPNWDAVIKNVKEAASTVPDLRYLGWDVAVLDEGVELIEANHDPAHDLIQMIDQVGKYDVIQKYIK